MAEDWSKFESEWKRLEPRVKKCSFDQAEKLWKALEARDKLLESHEKMLQKAAVDAWEKGVKGKTVTEFLKDKGFNDAKKLLDTDRRLLTNELNELKVYCEECDAVSKPLDKLTIVMAKAIKSTKEKSAERDKVKKLFVDLEARLKDIHEAAHLRYKPDKYMTTFNSQYDKLIEHLLTEALKKVKEEKVEDELPQPLEEKKLKAAALEARDLRGDVEVPLGDAIALKQKGEDLKDIPGLVKKAQQALTKLKALAARHNGLAIKFKKEIALSKEKDDIAKQIDTIDNDFRDAEKFMRQAAATLKK